MCLKALYDLAAIISQMKSVEKSDSFDISVRNTMYFSLVDDQEKLEEYMSGFKMGNMLSAFDKFFGDDEAYLALKKSIVQ